MSIFDRLLAGERVTVEAHGQRFDLTYESGENPCLTTHHDGNVTSTALAVDAARAHVEEQVKRYGWRDVDAPVVPEPVAAHAEIEAPVATLIAEAVAAVEAPAPLKIEPVKIEAMKVKIAPVKTAKREPTFDTEETPTERPSKKVASKKKGKTR